MREPRECSRRFIPMTIHAQCNDASRSALAAFRGIWFALMRCVIAVALAAANAEEATTVKPLPEQAEFFETKIRPLFANECFRCHSDEAKKLKGELHLDSRAGMLKGGETGAAVVPGNPDASLLIKAVRYKDQDTAMPPKKRLADAQIADLEAWVKMGSPWPEHAAAAVPVAPVAAEKKSYDWEKFRAEHWAFRKVVKWEPPAVSDAAWVRGPIDHFVLARLEAAARL